MSVSDGITRYFLRMYAVELGRTERRRGWGPFGEAVFQTVLLVLIPIIGVCAAGLVLMGASQAGYRWLMEYRAAVIGCFAILPLVAAFTLVKGLVWGYRESRGEALKFGTRRDRVVSNLQFWVVLLGSLALPWVAAAWIRMAH